MHKINHASVAHKMIENHCVQRTKPTKHEFQNKKIGIVENSLRILDLCRTPESDSTNPWGSIEPRLTTTDLKSYTGYDPVFPY